MSKAATKARSSRETSPNSCSCWLRLPSLDAPRNVDLTDNEAELQLLVRNVALSRRRLESIFQCAEQSRAGMLMVRLEQSDDWNWREQEPRLLELIDSVLVQFVPSSVEKLSCGVADRQGAFTAVLITQESAVPPEFREGWSVRKTRTTSRPPQSTSKEVDDSRKTSHIGPDKVSLRGDVKEKKRSSLPPESIQAVFAQATAADIAEFSAADLSRLQNLLAEAEILQARRLVGLGEDAEITLAAVNKYFKRNSGVELNPEDKDRLSRLITYLRSEKGAQLTITQEGETYPCTWTSFFRKETGKQLIVLREIGGDRRCFWRRGSLPSGLKLQRS